MKIYNAHDSTFRRLKQHIAIYTLIKTQSCSKTAVRKSEILRTSIYPSYLNTLRHQRHQFLPAAHLGSVPGHLQLLLQVGDASNSRRLPCCAVPGKNGAKLCVCVEFAMSWHVDTDDTAYVLLCGLMPPINQLLFGQLRDQYNILEVGFKVCSPAS